MSRPAGNQPSIGGNQTASRIGRPALGSGIPLPRLGIPTRQSGIPQPRSISVSATSTNTEINYVGITVPAKAQRPSGLRQPKARNVPTYQGNQPPQTSNRPGTAGSNRARTGIPNPAQAMGRGQQASYARQPMASNVPTYRGNQPSQTSLGAENRGRTEAVRQPAARKVTRSQPPTGIPSRAAAGSERFGFRPPNLGSVSTITISNMSASVTSSTLTYSREDPGASRSNISTERSEATEEDLKEEPGIEEFNAYFTELELAQKEQKEIFQQLMEYQAMTQKRRNRKDTEMSFAQEDLASKRQLEKRLKSEKKQRRKLRKQQKQQLQQQQQEQQQRTSRQTDVETAKKNRSITDEGQEIMDLLMSGPAYVKSPSPVRSPSPRQSVSPTRPMAPSSPRNIIPLPPPPMYSQARPANLSKLPSPQRPRSPQRSSPPRNIIPLPPPPMYSPARPANLPKPPSPQRPRSPQRSNSPRKPEHESQDPYDVEYAAYERSYKVTEDGQEIMNLLERGPAYVKSPSPVRSPSPRQSVSPTRPMAPSPPRNIIPLPPPPMYSPARPANLPKLPSPQRPRSPQRSSPPRNMIPLPPPPMYLPAIPRSPQRSSPPRNIIPLPPPPMYSPPIPANLPKPLSPQRPRPPQRSSSPRKPEHESHNPYAIVKYQSPPRARQSALSPIDEFSEVDYAVTRTTPAPMTPGYLKLLDDVADLYKNKQGRKLNLAKQALNQSRASNNWADFGDADYQPERNVRTPRATEQSPRYQQQPANAVRQSPPRVLSAPVRRPQAPAISSANRQELKMLQDRLNEAHSLLALYPPSSHFHAPIKLELSRAEQALSDLKQVIELKSQVAQYKQPRSPPAHRAISPPPVSPPAARPADYLHLFDPLAPSPPRRAEASGRGRTSPIRKPQADLNASATAGPNISVNVYPDFGSAMKSPPVHIARSAVDPKMKPASPPRPAQPKTAESRTQKAGGLRLVTVPASIFDEFLALARDNTERNIETCGYLTGKVNERNQLVVTHLLIPKQRGTSDTCEALDELETLQYQVDHDLMTIGWIHTHPTQTPFLSSVDVHTHMGYQLLVEEAVAIVCAPSYRLNKIFMLEPQHGFDVVFNCNLRGFHNHNTSLPIYIEAEHVRMGRDAPLQIADNR